MRRSTFVWLLLAAACALPHARAADLWVAPTGVDLPGCLDTAAPCRTVGYAVGQAAASGDTIHIAPGTYLESAILDKVLTIRADAGATVDAARLGRVFTVRTGGDALLVGLTITNGSATGSPAWGGGLLVDGGRVTLEECTVSANSATHGGGLAIRNGGSATLRRSTVARNRVVGGGAGIFNQATLHLDNSTVSANTAGEEGGALFNTGTAVLSSSTIAGNAAELQWGVGGIVCRSSPVTMRNTIVAGNAGLNSLTPDCSGFIDSVGYNLIGIATGCTLSGNTTGDLTGVSPGLDVLRANGGPTETQALLEGSPAIDGGDPAGCVDHGGQTLLTDQRGEPRPLACGTGPRCDIGAFEGCGARVPRLYESTLRAFVIAPANDRGLVRSPADHAPAPARTLFYQVDDGYGAPAVIRMIRTGALLQITF